MIILFVALIFSFLVGLGSGIWLKQNSSSELKHKQKLELIQAEKDKEYFLMMQAHENKKELMHF